MQTLVKLLVFISEQEMRHLHRVCGILYLRSTANVRLLTPISGQRMPPCYARKRHQPVGKESGKTSYTLTIEQHT